MSVQFDGNRIGPGVGHISRLLSFIAQFSGDYTRTYLQVEGLSETSVKAGRADEEESLGLILQVTFL